MGNILLFLWQLPQMMIGIVIYALFGRSLLRRVGMVRVYSWRFMSGLSLGWFCFVPAAADDSMIRHEFGHSRQSLVLGPFYLIVIGLPSLSWAIAYRFRKCSCDYLSFYTERWAEKEGSQLL